MKLRAPSLSPVSLLAAGAMLCAGSAFAADTSGMTPQQRYQAERAACEAGQTGQVREACMREAGAALQESRRGNLQSNRQATDYQSNAAARCDRLPPERRTDCMALRGDNVQVQGSVPGGAILRQTTIREVGTPGSPPPAGTPMTPPPGQGMPPVGTPAPGASGAYPAAPAGTTAPPPTYTPPAGAAPTGTPGYSAPPAGGTYPAPAGSGMRSPTPGTGIR